MTGTAFVGVPATHASPMTCVDSSKSPPIDPTAPCGAKCRFNSTTDVTREAGWQPGATEPGPLVTAEAGTLKCTVHVNNNIHSGAAVATETKAGTGNAAVVMEPRPLNSPATAADDVSLC